MPKQKLPYASIALCERVITAYLCIMSGLAFLKRNQKYDKMSVIERWDLAAPEIDAIMAKSRENKCIPIMLRDEGFTVLAEYGLGEVKPCAWMDTGFHPMNRSKSGIIPAKVGDKITHFHTKGISLLECSKAVSVARIPGAVGDQHEAENIAIAKKSDGHLAPVKQGSLTQFTLTCNHTVQAVKAVMAEARHGDKEIAPEGTINRALIESRQPSFAQTARNGAPFFQINGIVEVKRPQFISLLIETDNIPNAIAARDTSSTLLWKAFNAITDIDSNADSADMGDKEKLDLAIARVAMSEIGKDDEIPAYVHFARDWSGGGNRPVRSPRIRRLRQSESRSTRRTESSSRKAAQARFRHGRGGVRAGRGLEVGLRPCGATCHHRGGRQPIDRAHQTPYAPSRQTYGREPPGDQTGERARRGRSGTPSTRARLLRQADDQARVESLEGLQKHDRDLHVVPA